MKDKNRKLLVGIAIVLVILVFILIAKNADPEYFRTLGLTLPLPIFTFLIAILDGFNPCTMWVLTFLITLLVSVSHSRKKIFVVGYTFAAVVYVFYFVFMAAWLNIFLYLGFVDALRITIGGIAIIAGLINVKEYFAFRKGITLMIQEKHKAPLVRRIDHMKEIIKNGSIIVLIPASIVLAAFASLIELPCTAGWPIIYTKILAEKVFTNSASYYSYLLLYNLIYIIPLVVIITILGFLLKGKQITKNQMQLIKVIGGIIMLLLGIILLINPQLLMLVQ